MFDFDLAEMYGIENKRIKEQVRRNLDRFRADFMFLTTPNEISQKKISLTMAGLMFCHLLSALDNWKRPYATAKESAIGKFIKIPASRQQLTNIKN